MQHVFLRCGTPSHINLNSHNTSELINVKNWHKLTKCYQNYWSCFQAWPEICLHVLWHFLKFVPRNRSNYTSYITLHSFSMSYLAGYTHVTFLQLSTVWGGDSIYILISGWFTKKVSGQWFTMYLQNTAPLHLQWNGTCGMAWGFWSLHVGYFAY
jgi:hypothetical protein